MTGPTVYDLELTSLAGDPAPLSAYRGQVVLAVNVASRCGLTPQYEALERLQRQYAGRGFSVLGFPCNQFAGQEPGSAEEIQAFCSTTYGVTFPMFAKLDVNGPDRHPLYAILTETEDDNGGAGDVLWNFEKFVVSPEGLPVRRFRPRTVPEAPELVAAIEEQLAGPR